MTLDPHHPLDRRLLEFAEAMKAKFVARETKHPCESSVTHPGFNWRLDLDAQVIRAHALGEMFEWEEELAPTADPERRAAEAIDVANMMFLDRQIVVERRPQNGPDVVTRADKSTIDQIDG